MAKIFSFDLLVDDDFDEDRVLELLRSERSVIDLSLGDEKFVNEVLNDSLVNETYTPGDAFSGFWLVSCPSNECDRSFWSQEYGWVDFNLATRFDCTAEMPEQAKNDGGIFVKFY